jgi:hypothetical protein
MGLLDDAIREHLELKRRRGADPGEVAREQQEALDPLPGNGQAGADEDATRGQASLASEAVAYGSGEDAQLDARPVEDDLPDLSSAVQPMPDAGDSSVAQETAELDMRSVLDEEDGPHAAHESPVGSVGAAPVVSASVGDDPEEDSLEWEIQRDPAGEPAEAEGHRDHAGGGDGPGREGNA